MHRFITFLIALGAVALGVYSPASSQGLMTLGAGSVKGVVATSGPVFAFKGTDSTNIGADVFNVNHR
jgi:hypothetical protein